MMDKDKDNCLDDEGNGRTANDFAQLGVDACSLGWFVPSNSRIFPDGTA